MSNVLDKSPFPWPDPLAATLHTTLTELHPSGKAVVSISAQSLVVKDRRGNAVNFARAETTTVEGKSGWNAIAAGDKVLVRWNLGSGIARQVVVLEGPPRAAPR